MIDNSIIEQARNADIIAFLEKYHGLPKRKAACRSLILLSSVFSVLT